MAKDRRVALRITNIPRALLDGILLFLLGEPHLLAEIADPKAQDAN
jgi:hypothetical protein